MIKTPYNSACVTPCARLADFLVKKLTVRGTIGKMQGMKKAKNPPMTPAINIPHKDLLSSWGLLSTSPVIDSVPAVSMSGAASPGENQIIRYLNPGTAVYRTVVKCDIIKRNQGIHLLRVPLPYTKA